MTQKKFEGLVSLTQVQIAEHRMTHKMGKEPVFTVVLENLKNKKERICFYANNDGLYTQYPLEHKFTLEVKTPQSALSDYLPETQPGKEAKKE
jgi:hypothetical protein